MAWDSRPLEDLKTISSWVDQGRYDEARHALARHLARSPHHGEARFLLAKVLAARKDLNGSVEQLHLVPYWSTKKPEALALEGRYDLTLGRARDAEAAWRACIEYDPGLAPPEYAKFYHDVNVDLIRLYRVEGRLAEARAATWRVYERTKPVNHPAILGLRLQTELRPIPPEEASRELRRYVAASPDDWQAVRALARVEQALGHPGEANRLIRACLAAWPDDPEVLSRPGGDPGGTRRPGGLGSSPGPFARLRSRRRDLEMPGIAREGAGDLDSARAAYLQATRLDPSDPDSWGRLAGVEKRLGQAEVAEGIAPVSKVRDARSELQRAYSDYRRATRPNRSVATDPTPVADPPGHALRDARMAARCRRLVEPDPGTLIWGRDEGEPVRGVAASSPPPPIAAEIRPSP